MAGLVPAIHDFAELQILDVDARDKRGHDDSKAKRHYSALILASRAISTQLRYSLVICL